MVKGITDYGKEIKAALLLREKNQNWLIEQVKEKTGLYFDSAYLHKIMTGAEKSQNIIAAINSTLDISLPE